MRSRSPLLTLDDGAYRNNWLGSVQRFVDSVARSGNVCRLCGIRTDGIEICGACKNDLPWRVTPWTKQLPHVDGVAVAFDFAYPIRQLIHRTKYGRDIVCARFLGELFAERLAQIASVPHAATLFPVPLARSRMLVRGFNQAMEISLPVMCCLQLPIDVVSIYKPQARKTQSSLDARRRRANIRGAFKHRDLLSMETAIIVDDVLTTGATVSAMASTLKAAGAKRVVAWVVAAA